MFLKSRNQPSQSLAYIATAALATWGSVAITSFCVRRVRRRKNKLREIRVANDGGLLPRAANIVEALEYRGTTDLSCDQLALEGANGKMYTWKEYRDQVRAFGLALQNRFPGERSGITIHAFNRPEWFFSAVGALAVGYTVSGIYLTNTYEQAKHIIETSEVKVLVLEGLGLLETTYKTVLKDFPQLMVILLDGGDSDPSSRTPSYDAFVEASLQEVGTIPLVPLEKDDVACLVYTSGTTGNPKAVELTHGNIKSVCAMMHARIPLDDKSVFVSYLPLSHIAAMGIDMCSPIFCGGAVHFADADALRGTLKDTLLRVRPTLFFGKKTWYSRCTSGRRNLTVFL
jgi:long-chain-fatty-acid--CoA ligase ACSBG